MLLLMVAAATQLYHEPMMPTLPRKRLLTGRAIVAAVDEEDMLWIVLATNWTSVVDQAIVVQVMLLMIVRMIPMITRNFPCGQRIHDVCCRHHNNLVLLMDLRIPLLRLGMLLSQPVLVAIVTWPWQPPHCRLPKVHLYCWYDLFHPANLHDRRGCHSSFRDKTVYFHSSCRS